MIVALATKNRTRLNGWLTPHSIKKPAVFLPVFLFVRCTSGLFAISYAGRGGWRFADPPYGFFFFKTKRYFQLRCDKLSVIAYPRSLQFYLQGVADGASLIFPTVFSFLKHNVTFNFGAISSV